MRRSSPSKARCWRVPRRDLWTGTLRASRITGFRSVRCIIRRVQTHKETAMKKRIDQFIEAFDDRTGLHTALRKFLYEEIPQSIGWHQIFGSVALFLILIQFFTGAMLAFNNAPTT